MQSRKGSAIEVGANIGTGFIVSWILTLYLLPLFGYGVSAGQASVITIIYTVVSIIRSYLWRRAFNYLLIKKILK